MVVCDSGGDLEFKSPLFEEIQRLFIAQCQRAGQYLEENDVKAAIDIISRWKQPNYRCLTYQIDGHLSSSPNVAALSAAGYTDIVKGRFQDVGNGIDPYVRQISASAHEVLTEREEIGLLDIFRSFPVTPDLNLFAPAIYPSAYTSLKPKDAKGQEQKQFEVVLRMLKEQTGYNFQIESEEEQRAVLKPDSDDSANLRPHPLIALRQKEVLLASECISTLCASELSAALRLPNNVNHLEPLMSELGTLIRSEQTPELGLRAIEIFGDVQTELEKCIPWEFLEVLGRTSNGIRIISDAPLEWIKIKGIPLGLSTDLSRIPVTPGNLFVEQLSSKPYIRLFEEDFKEILVLSALDRSDPIQKYFNVAFSQFQTEWREKVIVRFESVNSEQQLIDCLNSFDGALAIFDGHGCHDPEGPAKIFLKDEAVDVWQLSRSVERIPPIVLLSACDTHAAGANHATTAAGFLALGSRAVLGTVFPISAMDAALFAARLVYRVFAFIPAATKAFDRAFTWNQVSCGMVRMQFLSEFLRNLERQGIITADDYRDIHIRGNNLINSFQPDAFHIILEKIYSRGVARDTVDAIFQASMVSSSFVNYVNLGRPETIIVDARNRFEQHAGKL